MTPGREGGEGARRTGAPARKAGAKAAAKSGASRAPAGKDARTYVIGLKVGDLVDELPPRVGPGRPESAVVRRDLHRLYASYRDALERLMREHALIPRDLALLGEVLAGERFDAPRDARRLWAYAADALGDDHRLVGILRGLPLATLWAIIDAVERGVVTTEEAG